MKRSKQFRRHQAARNLKKVRRMVRNNFHVSQDDPHYCKVVNKHRKQRSPCSCSCCGNPRKIEGPTIQEIRQIDRESF